MDDRTGDIAQRGGRQRPLVRLAGGRGHTVLGTHAMLLFRRIGEGEATRRATAPGPPGQPKRAQNDREPGYSLLGFDSETRRTLLPSFDGHSLAPAQKQPGSRPV